MKKRSVSSIILLDIITLGFYELYWLTKTRNEIAQRFQLKIPSAWWLFVTKAIQIGCVLFTVYAVLYVIPANNKKIDSSVRPSAECFVEYAQSNDPERANGQPTVSQNCRSQVDNYYQADNSTDLLLIVLGLYILSSVLTWLVLKRWFVPYAEALAKATQQKLSSMYAMTLLTVIPPPFGMAFIQNAFNKL